MCGAGRFARENDAVGIAWLQSMQARHAFAEFVPLSATKPAEAARLLGIVAPYLPEQEWLHDADAMTRVPSRVTACTLPRA